MDTQDAVEIARQAMLACMLLGAPVLITAMLVGLLVGLAQAVTQVQDQTIPFVAKLLSMIAVLSFTLPWLLTQLVTYCEELIVAIPDRL